MKTDYSLTCSQEPATGPYSESFESSSPTRVVFHTSGFFPSGFPTEILHAFLISTISVFLILLNLNYLLVNSTIHEALLCDFVHSSVTSSRYGPDVVFLWWQKKFVWFNSKVLIKKTSDLC